MRENYSVWKVVIFKFVFLHCESEIERGLNINHNLLVENSKESPIAQRSVKDFIMTQVSVDILWINSMMIKICKTGSSIYR